MKKLLTNHWVVTVCVLAVFAVNMGNVVFVAHPSRARIGVAMATVLLSPLVGIAWSRRR